MSRPAAFQFLNINCGLGAEEGSIVQCAVHDDCETARFHLLFETACAFGLFLLTKEILSLCSRFSLDSTSFGLPFLQPLG